MPGLGIGLGLRFGGFGGFGRTGGAALPPVTDVPANALTFSTGEPLQFSNGQYLELAA